MSAIRTPPHRQPERPRLRPVPLEGERDPAQASDPHLARPAPSKLVRAGWAGLGFLFVVIGSIGVVIPGLPTTPFLLLAASCFLRSSQRLYDKLLASRLFGPAVRAFREGRGVPRQAKAIAIGTMWCFVAVAVLFLIPEGQALWRASVVVLALMGTIYLVRLPSYDSAD